MDRDVTPRRRRGLSLEDPPAYLAPSEVDDDQIAYALAEWPAEERAIASAVLAGTPACVKK